MEKGWAKLNSPLPRPSQSPPDWRELSVLSARTSLPLCKPPAAHVFTFYIWFDAYVLMNERILTLTSAPDAPGMSSAIFLRLMPRVRFIFLEWIFKMSRRAWWCRNVQIIHTLNNNKSCEVLIIKYLFVRRGELYLPVDPAWPEQSRVQDVDTVGGHDDLQKHSCK